VERCGSWSGGSDHGRALSSGRVGADRVPGPRHGGDRAAGHADLGRGRRGRGPGPGPGRQVHRFAAPDAAPRRVAGAARVRPRIRPGEDGPPPCVHRTRRREPGEPFRSRPWTTGPGSASGSCQNAFGPRARVTGPVHRSSTPRGAGCIHVRVCGRHPVPPVVGRPAAPSCVGAGAILQGMTGTRLLAGCPVPASGLVLRARCRSRAPAARAVAGRGGVGGRTRRPVVCGRWCVRPASPTWCAGRHRQGRAISRRASSTRLPR
jgi:hypothetical protein